MSVRPTLQVNLSMLDNLSAPLRETAATVKTVADGMNATLGFLGAATGLYALKAGFESLVEAGSKAAVSIAELKRAVESSGVSWQDFAAHADGAIESVRKLGVYTDTQLRDTLARLTTATGNAGGAVSNLGLVADIATARHIDLSKAADLVAKAMEGNFTALKRLGIFVEAGQDGLAVLRERYTGATAAMADNDGGVHRLAASWEHFKEVLGLAIVGMDDFKEKSKATAEALDRNAESAGKLVGGIVKLAIDFAAWINNAGERLGYGLQQAEALLQLFAGKAIVLLADIGVRGFGWLPNIGDVIKAAGEKAQQYGQDLVNKAVVAEAVIEEQIFLSQRKTVDAAKDYTTKINAITMDSFDQQTRAAQQAGIARVKEGEKTATSLDAAEKHLTTVYAQYYKLDKDGRVAATAEGVAAILLAETDLAMAQEHISEAKGKKATAAQEKAAKELDAWTHLQEQYMAELQAADNRFADEFLKSFAGDMPKAAQEVVVKIKQMQDEIDKMREKARNGTDEELHDFDKWQAAQ